jgi:hypothetical protein
MEGNEKLGFRKSVRSQKRSRAGVSRHASFYSCMVTRRLGPDGPVKHLPPQATSFASSVVLKDEHPRPESDEHGAPPKLLHLDV